MLLTDARRPARTDADGDAGPARRAGPRALGPRRTSPRASRWSPTTLPRGAARPVPAAGGDRRRPRRGAARRGHRLAADPRALRAARAHRAQPDGHAQPRGRGGDGRTDRGPGSTLLGDARRRRPRSPATTGSTRCAPTCWRWPATAAAARAGYRDARRAARPACPSSATSRRAPRGSTPPRPTSSGRPARRPARARSGRSRSERRARARRPRARGPEAGSATTR